MKKNPMRTFLAVIALTATLAAVAVAQRDTGPVQGNAGQPVQPGGATSGAGNSASSSSDGTSPRSGAISPSSGSRGAADTSPGVVAGISSGSRADNAPADDNPYNPLLEIPPLPKSNTTLIGGFATSIDHVRNRLTVQPFGRGEKVKLFTDERTHIYRNGAETTVLGIHKGDRVYVDTITVASLREMFGS